MKFLAAAIAVMMFSSISFAGPKTPASAPASAPAKVVVKAPSNVVAPTPPSTAAGALGDAVAAYRAAKSGKWWYLASLVCLVIMFILKISGLLKKMGRAKYIVLPLLSLGAGLLAAFQGGVSVGTAVGVFSASWATASLEELWNHGILGKEHS